MVGFSRGLWNVQNLSGVIQTTTATARDPASSKYFRCPEFRWARADDFICFIGAALSYFLRDSVLEVAEAILHRRFSRIGFEGGLHGVHTFKYFGLDIHSKLIEIALTPKIVFKRFESALAHSQHRRVVTLSIPK